MRKMFQTKSWDGHWSNPSLLTQKTINSVRDDLTDTKAVFTSVQNYDDTGAIVSCPIYADFDGTYVMARHDTINFINSVRDLLATDCYIYFSGSKGFHVVVPYTIEHNRCGQIAQLCVERITEDYDCPTLDKGVYGYKRMLRLNGSIHHSTGLFKTRITLDELVSLSQKDMYKLCSHHGRRDIADPDPEEIDELSCIGLVHEAITQLPIFVASNAAVERLGVDEEITPCLKHLLNHAPAVGSRNNTVYILARFFHHCGTSVEEAMDIFLTEPHYAELEETENNMITRVVKSVFKGPRHPLGCKSGIGKDIMTMHCSKMCWFNDEMFPFKKKG